MNNRSFYISANQMIIVSSVSAALGGRAAYILQFHRVRREIHLRPLVSVASILRVRREGRLHPSHPSSASVERAACVLRIPQRSSVGPLCPPGSAGFAASEVRVACILRFHRVRREIHPRPLVSLHPSGGVPGSAALGGFSRDNIVLKYNEANDGASPTSAGGVVPIAFQIPLGEKPAGR